MVPANQHLLKQFVDFDITGNIQFCNRGFNQLSISERSEFVGYVMQNPNHMISEKMIYDEVALGLRARGMKE